MSPPPPSLVRFSSIAQAKGRVSPLTPGLPIYTLAWRAVKARGLVSLAFKNGVLADWAGQLLGWADRPLPRKMLATQALNE